MKKARIFTLALATGSLAITSACTDPAYQSRSNTEKGALTGAGVGADVVDAEAVARRLARHGGADGGHADVALLTGLVRVAGGPVGLAVA